MTAGRRWERRPEARREEILEAAVAVFADLGYSRATLADVARGAGVSAGTVSHYFRTKEALFEELIRQKMERVAAVEAALAEPGRSHEEILRRVLGHFSGMLSERGTACLSAVIKSERGALPGAARIMIEQVGERFRRLLVRLVEGGIEAGEFRPVDAEAVAAVLIPALAGVIQDYHMIGGLRPQPLPLERHVAAWMDLTFAGLLADVDSRSRELPAPESSLRP